MRLPVQEPHSSLGTMNLESDPTSNRGVENQIGELHHQCTAVLMKAIALQFRTQYLGIIHHYRLRRESLGGDNQLFLQG